MKKLLLGLALLSSSVIAQEDVIDKTKNCESISNLAKQVMINRQSNVAMSKMVNIFKKEDGLTFLVVMAYEQPRFSTVEYQTKAADDFANEIYMLCYTAK